MALFRGIIVALVIIGIRTAASQNRSHALLLSLLDPAVYDSTVRPRQEEGVPVLVEIDVAINSIGPVSESTMDMTTSFFLRQTWVDPRLTIPDLNASITLSNKLRDKLWLPDLYFANGKEEHMHDITTPNVLLRLYPNGRILYSQRLTITTQCLMDLSNFPHDHQSCSINMESYSYVTDDVYFNWHSERSSTNVLPHAHIPDFSLIGVDTHDCSVVYATGTFTCLAVRLSLQREIGFYLTQTYIPSVLIVMLSWASFWIDHAAVPARISVGLLTVLTITTQSSGARAQLPRVPYIKAIDVWMSVCLVFVFTAYMEYAVVCVLSRRHKKRPIDSSFAKQNGETEDGGETGRAMTATPRRQSYELSSASLTTILKKPNPRDPADTTDKISRFLFPASFLVFNAVYWVYYVTVD